MTVPHHRIGNAFALTVVLVAAGGLGSAAALNFPQVLLNPRSFAVSLVATNLLAVAVSQLCLLVAGVMLVRLCRVIGSVVPEHGRRHVLLLGSAVAYCWVASALLCLILVPLWANNIAAGATLLARIALGFGAVAAPVLMAAWIAVLARLVRGAGMFAALGVLGLAVAAVRSVFWALNSSAPSDGGFYVTSAILTVAALFGYPMWIFWLARMAVLFRNPGARRRWALVPLAALFVVAHAGVTVASEPTPESGDVPSVPSSNGAVMYTVLLGLPDLLPTDHADLLAQRQSEDFTNPVVPKGTTLRQVDAGGVKAESLCATGAAADRVVLYLPGGGFMLPPSNGARAFAGELSRQTGACVLMATYRLAPEHPYPAAIQDSVTAYRWLRGQGMVASRIVIMGDSAGANLTFATALSLRDNDEALPAALVSFSPILDFTRSGETWRTKASGEGLIQGDTVDFTLNGYTNNGAADPRDPLLSPLFADLRGLPPTLLMVGGQEVLLSDSTRMADRLSAAGVPAQLEVWPGMPHAWYSAFEGTPEFGLTMQHLATFVSRALPTRP